MRDSELFQAHSRFPGSSHLAFRGEGNTYTHGNQRHDPGQGAGPRRRHATPQPIDHRRRGERRHRRRPVRRCERLYDPGHREHFDLDGLVIIFGQQLTRAADVDHPGQQLIELRSGGLGRILIF